MQRVTPVIRYRLSAIIAAHWWTLVLSYGRFIRPVVFENVERCCPAEYLCWIVMSTNAKIVDMSNGLSIPAKAVFVPHTGSMQRISDQMRF